jgi:hypothetical protein
LVIVDSKPVAQHAFNKACETTLNRCLGIGSQRGGEYLDSWHVDNQVTTFIDHVLAIHPEVKAAVVAAAGANLKEFKRLLMAAALVDVKDSRMSGPWKTDTVDDGINYRGAFADWRDEYGR